MNPEVLLTAKLAWVLLVCSGFLVRAGHAGVAFAPWGDTVPEAVLWLVRPAFLVAGLLLLANQFTRPAAVVAGICALVTPLESIAAWRSEAWICGAVLLLAGLDQPGERPWLLRAQATLCILAVVLDRTGAIDWTTEAALEGWQVDRDTPSLIQGLRALLPASWMQFGAGWLVPATAIATAAALWIPSIRNRGIWFACAWLLCGYVLVATEDAAFFTLAVLINLLAFLNWPRESLVVHWPRACGWPMWLRIALDHYDFDRKTEWPFPQNPDADLDVWVDRRHLPCRRGISALLLYFPLFHMAVFATAVVLLLVLPRPWSTVAHVSMGAWLLVFFALPLFLRLSERWRR